jgi:3-isopropylmalate/(R)-2-methylmalate dehydratase large subunit
MAPDIATSEVEHVTTTQALLAKNAKNMMVKVDLRPVASAKGIVLDIIGEIDTAGGTGYTFEFADTGTVTRVSI